MFEYGLTFQDCGFDFGSDSGSDFAYLVHSLLICPLDHCPYARLFHLELLYHRRRNLYAFVCRRTVAGLARPLGFALPSTCVRSLYPRSLPS